MDFTKAVERYTITPVHIVQELEASYTNATSYLRYAIMSDCIKTHIRGFYQKSLPLIFPRRLITLTRCYFGWTTGRLLRLGEKIISWTDRVLRVVYIVQYGITLSAIVQKLWGMFGHTVSRHRRQQCRRNSSLVTGGIWEGYYTHTNHSRMGTLVCGTVAFHSKKPNDRKYLTISRR